MLLHIVRRLLVSALLVIGLMTLVFFVLHAVPGDPAARYITPEMDPGTIELVRRNLGLDAPLPVQYGKFMHAFLLRRDFGLSLSRRRPVSELLRDSIPNTTLLVGLALALRFALGIAAGTLAATHRDRALDRVLSVGALVVYSMPAFWLGLMAILIFALHLHWLPVGQLHSLDHGSLPPLQRFADSVAHLVLPVLVLAVGGVASTARYMRASLIEALSQDYVRTARAKGLTWRRVVLRHAMRNALVPIVTLLGLSLPGLVGGALVVEAIFSWPGMGRLTHMALSARDYPVLLAVTFVSAVMVVVGNLLADLACAALDPRLRTE